MNISINADAVIVGAGPCGLFQVFELGLLGIDAHVVDALPVIGGQCTALYPEKPIYDIPALPIVGAAELINQLAEQIRPFAPSYHLGQQVVELQRRDDGRFRLVTSADTEFVAKTIVIAGGLGSFLPRPLRLPDIARFEAANLHYKVADKERFRDKQIIILGGGDSALDWVLALFDIAATVTLIHRREEFRAAPASVTKMKQLAANDPARMRILVRRVTGFEEQGGSLSGLKVAEFGSTDESVIALDELLVFYGLSPNLGPIADWGLEIDKRQIPVDTEKFQTSEPGIFAVGDINTYPGKKKLILSGFHEAALAAFAIQKHLDPNAKQRLQYTTTSPIMHKRLGVDGSL
ncbi:MAG: NAD(P)/FAD-dependent oxidoreductase [Gammaproteobacteria bacterium]|nr:NAD(P)/FAD-dependent oxidoreductase [Gammaproteobacteria bacterium]